MKNEQQTSENKTQAVNKQVTYPRPSPKHPSVFNRILTWLRPYKTPVPKQIERTSLDFAMSYKDFVREEESHTIDRRYASSVFMKVMEDQKKRGKYINFTYSFGEQGGEPLRFLFRHWDVLKTKDEDAYCPRPLSIALPGFASIGAEGVLTTFLDGIHKVFPPQNGAPILQAPQDLQAGFRGAWERILRSPAKICFLCLRIPESRIMAEEIRVFLEQLVEASQDEKFEPLFNRLRMDAPIALYIHVYVERKFPNTRARTSWKSLPFFKQSATNLGEFKGVTEHDLAVWFGHIFNNHPRRDTYESLFWSADYAGRYFPAPWYQAKNVHMKTIVNQVVIPFLQYVNQNERTHLQTH